MATLKVHGLEHSVEMKGLNGETKAPASGEKNTTWPVQSRWPFALKAPLFWFPYNVQVVPTRWVALQATIMGLLAIIYRKERTMWWAITCVFADYTIRFLMGGPASLMGAIGMFFAAITERLGLSKRTFTPGPPKQFAALVGAIFAGVAAVLGLVVDDDGTSASVIIAILMFCAFLEAVFDFCMGCLFYRIFVQIGIFSSAGNLKATEVYDEYVFTADEADARLDPAKRIPDPALVIGNLGAKGERTVPFKYHRSTVESQRQKFNLVTQMNVNYMYMPMGIVGLACAWKYANDPFFPAPVPAYVDARSIYSMQAPFAIWITIAIIGVVFFGSFLSLYLIKLLMKPRKVAKEWHSPAHRGGFSAITITVLLFAYLAIYEDRTFAKVLFWIAAPLQLYFSCTAVADWIKYPQDIDLAGPNMLIPVVGPLVASMLVPQLDADPTNSRYYEFGWLFFSFALLMWVVLLTISLYRVIFRGKIADDMRPSLWVYLAAPCVACSAYVALNLGKWDNFAKILFYIGICFFFVLARLTVGAFFGRPAFNMNNWAYVFPLDTLALVTLQYYKAYGGVGGLTEAMATAALVLATAVGLLCSASFLWVLVKQRIFVPEERSSPMASNHLVHYAFRNSLAAMNGLNIDNASDPEAAAKDRRAFSRLFGSFYLTLSEHSVHEDSIIFPAFNEFVPGVAAAQEHEHELLHRELDRVQQLVARIDQLDATPGADAAAEALRLTRLVKEALPALTKAVNEHLDHEETDLQWIGRKHFTNRQQKDLVRRVWNATSTEKWAKFIPFVVANNIVHQKRLNYLRALRAALPERMQLIGKFVYEGVDALLWERLAVDIPEMVPRNIPGWVPLQ